MKLIIACLLVAALTFIPSCGPEVEDQTAASTGAGGSSSSSSSSSGEGGMGGADAGPKECDPELQVKICNECKALGCPMADPNDPDKCHYVAVVMYTDMIGCLQWPGPQVNCPACNDITANMPITAECESCAKPFTPCSLNCAYELTGGMGGSPP